MVSRVCEEFNCLPSRAVEELEEDPNLIGTILILREFARRKTKYDRSGEADLPIDWMTQLIKDLDFDLAEE